MCYYKIISIIVATDVFLSQRGAGMIGERVKALRIGKNMTQKELAEKLNLTPKMISFYELGDRFPPHDILAKLADTFNVSVDHILGRSEINKKRESFITDEDLKLAFWGQTEIDDELLNNVKEYAKFAKQQQDIRMKK